MSRELGRAWLSQLTLHQVQTCANALSQWLSTAHTPTRPGTGATVIAG